VASTVRVSFSAPANSAAPIIAYRILVKEASGTFSEEPVNCDGQSQVVIDNLRCDIPLSVLRASPFSLERGALVQARVQARNANGWGGLSQVNLAGALVQTEPSAMSAPTSGPATSTTQLVVDFTALTGDQATGGAAIDSYNLQWDQGTGTWVDLVGQDGAYQLLTTYSVSSGVAGGEDYRFRVRAHNAHGWGPFSTVAVIYATSVPAQPPVATTT
jgi:hypothetical protein